MFRSNWFQSFASKLAGNAQYDRHDSNARSSRSIGFLGGGRRRRTRRLKRARLALETLEFRTMLAVTIPGTFDFFITDPGDTAIDLGTDPGGDNPPLPPGFFGTIGPVPSDPFVQVGIPLEGNPPVEDFMQFQPPLVLDWVDPHGNVVGPDSVHAVGQQLVPLNTHIYDTVVRRNDDAVFNAVADAPTVDIEIVALSLQSVDPIVVHYGSEGVRLWDVFVTLDETAVQPVGSMDLTSDTFVDGVSVSGSIDNLDLPVAFKVTFQEVDNPGNVREVPSTLANPTPPFGLPPAQFGNDPGTFAFPVNDVVVEKLDRLIVDLDGDGVADPGDTLSYSIGIGNFTPDDLTNVEFFDSHPDLFPVPGTLNVSPLANDDFYEMFGNTVFDSAFLGLPPVLANDHEVLPHQIGIDTFVTDFQPFSDAGGNVNVNPDGSFIYEPPLFFNGLDSFWYELTDPQGLIGTGVVDINVIGFAPSESGEDVSISASLNEGLNGPQETAAPIFLGTLPAGKTRTVAFDAEIGLLLPPQTEVSNQATLSWDAGFLFSDDPRTAAVGDATVTPVPQVDLELSKSDSVDPVDLGVPFTYQVTVTNNGPSTARDVSILDTLPSGVTWVSDDGPNVPPTAGDMLFFDIGDLANGQTVVWTINVIANLEAAGTTQTNIAVVSTTTNDANEANDVVSEDTTFSAPPSGPVVIVDDSDPEYSNVGTFIDINRNGHDGGFDYANSGTGNNTASWAFDVTPGIYQVSATWHAHINRAIDAPFTIFDGPVPLARATVNQQVAPSQFEDAGSIWDDLGMVQISGSMLIVELSDDVDGLVIADAIRVERLGDPAEGPEIHVQSGPNAILDDTGVLDFGVVTVGASAVRTVEIFNAGTEDLILTNPINVPAGFSLAAPFGATTLPPGAFTTFDIQADSSVVGPLSGEVSFSSNDADEEPYNFLVTADIVSVAIIDDGDSGHSTVGNWGTVTGANKGFAADFLHNGAGTGSETSTWTFSVAPGQYRVSATWQPFSNRATDAPFTVDDGFQDLGTNIVNQQTAPSTREDGGRFFDDLGIFDIFTSELNVTLSDLANGLVIADAIRVERIGDVTPDPEIAVDAGGTDIADGGLFDFGSVLLNDVVVQTFTVANTGLTPLVLDGPISVPIGFTAPAAFAVTTLNPGEATSFDVQADTSSLGPLSGEVSFGNNDSDEDPFNFTVQAEVEPFVAIVDNSGTPPNYTTVGPWTTVNRNGLNGNFQYITKGDGSSVATWTIDTPGPGTYLVGATWHAFSNRIDDAGFSVFDGLSPLVTVLVDQTVAPNDVFDQGRWFENLATITTIGSQISVELSNFSTDPNPSHFLAIADAIRVERL